MPPARVATIILDANIGPYSIKMTKAAVQGAATGKAIDSSMTKATTGTTKLGQATGVLPTKFGALASVGGAAFAGIGLAAAFSVKKFADFDVAMDAVGASTGATQTELDQLGKTAMEAAADTKFGATEAARGIEALAKAGIETADIMGGGLKGALDLAAAGEIEVAEASELAASAMTQFGLAGEDIPHIADLLAAGAGKAQGSVSDMGMALNQSGLVAAQMGLSIEETVGTLAMFAEAGLTGSDAGTSFRTMLLRLANPTDKARSLMSDLGIAAYDAAGNFVGMHALAGQLAERLGPLAQAERDAAMATLFGSDAIRGANIAYQNGAEGAADWQTEVTDAGFAAEQAAKRTDNLMGDLERLGGEVEALGIKLGGSADGPLRDFVQGLEELATEVSDEIDLWRNEYLPAVADVDNWIDQHLIPDFLELPDLIGRSTEETKAQAEAMERAAEVTATHSENLTGYAAAQAGATEAQEASTLASEDQGSALALAAEETEKMREETAELTEQFLASRDASRDYEAAIDDARQALEDNGATLDISTEKGRNNEEQLDQLATAVVGVMQSTEFLTLSQEDQIAKSDEMRAELIRAATRFGLTKDEANAYADEILQIPKAPTTTPKFVDTEAREKVAAFQSLLKNIASTIPITIRASTGGLGGFFTSGSTSPGGLPFLGRYPITQGPHDGGALDYGMPTGTPLRATFPGYLDVTNLGNRSYGMYYTLRGAGKYELGAHLSGFARGDGLIGTGQIIGWSGSTGNSTGPHLHLLRNFHTGGETGGGPINTLRGEYVVNASAYAANRQLVQAINSGMSSAGGSWAPTIVLQSTVAQQVAAISRELTYQRLAHQKAA